ncbi:MAG: hypothetical protein ACXWN0_11170 [Isosphaeraceae bacterium]
MRLFPRLALAFATLCMVAGATEVQADTISQWNFSTVKAAPYNSPAPDVGTGVATVLGMDNNYIFSSGNTITGSGTFTYTTLYSIGSVAYATRTSLRLPATRTASRTPGGFAVRAIARALRRATVGLFRLPSTRRELSSLPAPLATTMSVFISTGTPRPRA